MKAQRRVRVLLNPKSGTGFALNAIAGALEKHWAEAGVELTYQISRNKEDGQAKARHAVEEGVESVLVAGGDGMVNSIGSVLVGTDVALGVIPAGSGNGFARHFGIPLQPARAAAALVEARPQCIDVGVVEGHPFFVTCGMAADAQLVRHFERSPIRGILPYMFATAYEIFEYRPQNFRVVLDGGESFSFEHVLVFTVANLTQFGGGALIAPSALPDDGHLEMVVVLRQDIAGLLEGIPRLFGGTIDQLPGVITRRFQRLEVERQEPGAIQVDGELVEAPARVTVRIRRRALNVLVPAQPPA